MKIKRIILVLIGFLLVGQNLSAQIILRESGEVVDQYIVSFAHSVDITATIKRQKSRAFDLLRSNQQASLERLNIDLSDTDLTIKKSLWISQSVVVTISTQYLDRLNSLDYVVTVQPDIQYDIESLGIDTLTPSGETVSDNLKRIGIDSTWNLSYRGQGVVIAILDTGVDLDHKTLKTRWRGGNNSWFDPFSGSSLPSDFSGHGTAVASLALGGNEVVGAVGGVNYFQSHIGVAPNAQWIAAKIFGSVSNTDSSTISDILEALQWVLDPDGNSATDDYPDIVQNSWGLANSEGSCTNTEFNAALDAINALGIDIVFAVGNSGPTPQSHLAPSFHNDVISVGAVSTANPLVETIVSTSSRGPNACNSAVVLPSLVAPGFNVIAAQASFSSTSAASRVNEFTGTSFSSPMVSGALAILRSYFNKETAYLRFRTALFDSAKDLGSTGDDAEFGRGLIQVDAAVTSLLNGGGIVRSAEPVFSSANYVFAETAGSAEITVLRVGDITGPSSVTVISEAITASNGIDYTAVSSTINFSAGESMSTVTINLIDDNIAESTETFDLAIVGSSSKIRITVTDNDTAVIEDEIGGGVIGGVEILLFALLYFGRRFQK